MSQALFRKLRGTHDLHGRDALCWEELERAASDVFKRFGYEPIRTPILEEVRVFLRSVGEVTDIVQKEMYRFTDRSGDEIALRPEGTAGVVRSYIEEGLGKDRQPRKLYYMGPMFRGERPQAGRLRQFHQIGAELFGSASHWADLETMELMAAVLEAAGIKGYRFQVNDLGDAEDRSRYAEALRDFLKSQTGGWDPDSVERLERNPLRVLDSKNPKVRESLESAPRIASFVSDKSRERFDRILEGLTRAGIAFEVNPKMVRGLDYYTQTVFECTHSALGAQDAVGAGGRYDGLVDQMGGDPTPAVGFALGVERMRLIRARGEAVAERADRVEGVFFIGMSEEAKREAYALLSQLRKAGIRSELDFEPRSMKASMRQADKSGLRFTAILGEDEMRDRAVTLKDLSDQGKGAQERVPWLDLILKFNK